MPSLVTFKDTPAMSEVRSHMEIELSKFKRAFPDFCKRYIDVGLYQENGFVCFPVGMSVRVVDDLETPIGWEREAGICCIKQGCYLIRDWKPLGALKFIMTLEDANDSLVTFTVGNDCEMVDWRGVLADCG